MKLTAAFSHFKNYTDESKEELCNICLLIYVSNTKHQKWLISLRQNLEMMFSPLLSGIVNYTDWSRGKLHFKIKWQICCRLAQMGTFWGTTCLLLLSSTNVLFWGWIFLHIIESQSFDSLYFSDSCKHLISHLWTLQHSEVEPLLNQWKSLGRIWLSALCKVVLAVNYGIGFGPLQRIEGLLALLSAAVNKGTQMLSFSTTNL